MSGAPARFPVTSSRTGVITLSAEGISKHYGPVAALDQANLAIKGGEVHALAGENGSGKSTLLRILAGAEQPDSGTIVVDGQVRNIRSVHDARKLGIALVSQERAVLPDLTVAENILLGVRLPRRRLRVNWPAVGVKATEVLRTLGAEFDHERPVRLLRPDEQQQVEVARALAFDARVLLLDEPTSSLDKDEVERLFQVVKRLAGEGLAVVFISQRIREILDLADQVTVLRDGRSVASSARAQIDESWIVQHMVGRDLPRNHRSRSARSGSTGLRVDGVCDADNRVRNVTCDLEEGEIVGLAGLVGSGRTELLETIFGSRRRIEGTVEVAGQRVVNPATAIAAGMAFLTEDRRANGVVLSMSLRDNALLAARRTSVKPRQKRQETRAIEPLFRELRVRARSMEDPVGTLSGGNQQKVLFARALATRPKWLLLDEPTRGIDIGGKAEIYRIIADLVDSGMGVLMASSELPELLGLCDRVLVMHEGKVVDELKADDLTEERVVSAASGVFDEDG